MSGYKFEAYETFETEKKKTELLRLQVIERRNRRDRNWKEPDGFNQL